MKVKIFAIAAAALLLMSGCEKNITAPEETSGTSAAATTQTTAAAVQTTAAAEKPQKKISPLSHSAKDSYYEDEDFSVTVKLKKLQSSLYYPDIVHDMGANPKLFVVEANIKVKNISYEEKSFDCSKLAMTDGSSEFFLYSPENEDMQNIQSDKSASAVLRFLCTIEQAAEIEGMRYNGADMDTGEKFIPEDFEDVIDKQSAEDVRDYLYRPHYLHGNSGYFAISGTPTTYEMHHIKGVTDGENNYMAVSFSAYNRSDYAQLIEPKAFRMMCCKDDRPAEYAEPLYISTESDYIYDPKKIDIKIKGIGTLYEIPDFICTDPDGITEFTIIYDSKDSNMARLFSFAGTHDDEPYYSDIAPILAFEIALWPEE